MQDNRAEQIEALDVAKDYSVRLHKGIETLVGELRGGRLPDTEEYLNTVLKGINWVFEVYNATRELINENGTVIDKDKVNAESIKLNDALKAKDDVAVADSLEKGIAPFLLDLQKAVEAIHA